MNVKIQPWKGAKSKRLRPEQMRFDVLDGRRRKSVKSSNEKEWSSDDDDGEEERSKRTKNMISRQTSYAGYIKINLKVHLFFVFIS